MASNDLKMISLRLDPAEHADAQVAAELTGENMTEFIRKAIRERVAAVKADPAMREKAAEVGRQLDAEIAARRSAVASFIAPEIP